MFKPITFLIAACLTLIISSCSTEETQPSVYDTVKLELNDGEKWQVSPEMMLPMTTSMELIDSVALETKVDYTDIAEQLISNKSAFVSSCDMKGKGHDVLHSWLMPYIGLLDDLQQATTTAEQERIFDEILVAKSLFNEYFE
ncbi:MAG: hypothetical protein QNK23_10680 [Crocinitomicaceae bacterium]|nr:hypothetical protein [Crocinitomicaceae bacterium]